MSFAAPLPLRAPGAGVGSSVLRLGAVSYLNARPLVHGLEAEPRVRLEGDVPSRVARRLHAGEVDLGMIPSIEYTFGRYDIVPGIAIGSRGPVRSVSLYLSRPLDDVRRVALDTSSRTSVALVKVLLRERLGRDPEYVPMAPALVDMLAVADAALLIGDPALEEENTVTSLDVGEEWERLTGLPFVYAFWAGPRGVVTRAGVARLRAALDEGLTAVPQIAAAYANGRPERAATYESYLRANVVYRLGSEEIAGLREFYRRAYALDLAPTNPELSFHADQ
ncbi:MAG: menaquinone biosynthesis protein [Acidobacteria bacterium]|nr:menaquinone biosynthesis protein [Acidobacteriota bacterium]